MIDASDMREMSDVKLSQQLAKLHKDYFNLRMQRATEQLAQTHLLVEAKRDIARAKTIMREREIRDG